MPKYPLIISLLIAPIVAAGFATQTLAQEQEDSVRPAPAPALRAYVPHPLVPWGAPVPAVRTPQVSETVYSSASQPISTTTTVARYSADDIVIIDAPRVATNSTIGSAVSAGGGSVTRRRGSPPPAPQSPAPVASSASNSSPAPTQAQASTPTSTSTPTTTPAVPSPQPQEGSAGAGSDAGSQTTASTSETVPATLGAQVVAAAQPQPQPQPDPQQPPQTQPAPQPQPNPQPNPTPTSTPPAPGGQGIVCNESLIRWEGLSVQGMIDLPTCQKLNQLYASGAAAGNAGDLYDNRDNLHVNFCVEWSPNPDCPTGNRLFPQHDWRSGMSGRALSGTGRPTIGQASLGAGSLSITNDMYQSQSGASALYDAYAGNSLYVYPSLSSDLDAASESLANTPYVIASKQICDCGTGSLGLHGASGSDLPFVELGMAGLAAFKPNVKSALADREMLMPTLQAMIRYAHKTVNGSDQAYLSSAAHRAASIAHVMEGGARRPAYDAGRLVDMVNGLSLNDAPPVVRLEVSSETFQGGEKLFDTPAAIARAVPKGTSDRTITVSAAQSSDAQGSGGLEYRFVVLDGDGARADVSQDGASATITFHPGDAAGRVDVGVFVKRQGGRYYSVPGIVSLYVRP